MADVDFYIDKAPQVSPKAPKNPKPLQGRWWKYGLVFAVVQVAPWLLLVYARNPGITVNRIITNNESIYGSFIFFGFLPFILARLGLKRMMWFVIVGVILGMGAYYLLVFFEPAIRVSILLPWISYLQLAFAGLSLGFLWEFGRWVFRKLKE